MSNKYRRARRWGFGFHFMGKIINSLLLVHRLDCCRIRSVFGFFGIVPQIKLKTVVFGFSFFINKSSCIFIRCYIAISINIKIKLEIVFDKPCPNS